MTKGTGCLGLRCMFLCEIGENIDITYVNHSRTRFVIFVHFMLNDLLCTRVPSKYQVTTFTLV